MQFHISAHKDAIVIYFKWLFVFFALVPNLVDAQSQITLATEPAELWHMLGFEAQSGGGTFKTKEEVLGRYNELASAAYENCIRASEYYSCMKRIPSNPHFMPGFPNKQNGDYVLFSLSVTVSTAWKTGPGSSGSTVVYEPEGGLLLFRSLRCPDSEGFSASGVSDGPNSVQVSCVKSEVPSLQCSPTVGNPIQIYNGVKTEYEVDFSTADGLMALERQYMGQATGWHFPGDMRLMDLHSRAISNQGISFPVKLSQGLGVVTEWLFSPYKRTGLNQEAFFINADGSRTKYTADTAGSYSTDVSGERIQRLTTPTAQGAVWRRTLADDTVEEYDDDGRIRRKQLRRGVFVDYVYQSGLLTQMQDSLNRRIALSYNAERKLISAALPDGTSINYAYANGLLSRVTYPDNTSRQYLYNEAGLVDATTSAPYSLTGKLDENNVRIGTYKYDNSRRAISTESANGVAKNTLSIGNGFTEVISPLGGYFRTTFVTVNGRTAMDAQNRPIDIGSQPGGIRYTYDAAGNVASSISTTDFYKSTKTCYAYDLTRNLETARIEGLSASADCPSSLLAATQPAPAQKTVTQWHPTFRLPVLITGAGRTMAYTYDVSGNKLTETITDTTANQSRTWAYTYTPQGLVATLADPRSAAAGKLWQFTYDASGNRTRVKNPLNQETVYTHDAAGRVLTETAPNGLLSSYTYDLRGRLLTATTGSGPTAEATSYTYTPSGQLASALLPNGYQVSYTYDPAQRLISAADNRSNTIAYTLDAMGNRTREEVKDASGQIALVTSRTINKANRMVALRGAGDQTTALTYDGNGDLLSQADPLNQTTTWTLDALRRPTSTKFADNATASQTYNALDQLTQATDPKGVATIYVRNAFGEVLRETSPDIGTTVYTRDAVGDVATMTDAKGNVTSIVRDVLGRPTQMSRSATDQSFFTWDAGTTGAQIGYLAKLQDKSGTTTYERDAFGRILSKTQAVNDNPASPSTYKTSYTYSTAATGAGITNRGELSSITYPSGLKVHYTRSPSGQISAISTQVPGTGKPITPFVSGLSYTALAQPKAWSWTFNGDAATRTFDTDGRMTSSELASYSFDAASRITAITQQLWASRTVTQTVGTGTATVTQDYKIPQTWQATYDNRNRLTGFTRAGSETRYTYDANSNRLSAIDKTISDTNGNGTFDVPDTALTASQTLTIQPTSNRLLGFAQTITNVRGTQTLSTTAASVTYSIDANGNLTSDGLRTFEYDESNRLAKVKILKDGEAASIKYLYNALGQQVFKSEPKPEQLLPNQTELGSSFITWLKNNFGWLYAQAQTDASLGSAYMYADGQLPSWAVLGEYDNGSASGTGRTEYIWLPTEDGSAIPVGMFRNSKFLAIHPDHLGSPRLMTDSTNKVVWQWAYSGFGNNKPMGVLKPTASATAAFTNQPVLLSAPAVAAVLDLRFPGQMADEETGLFLNHFRSYRPTDGAYTQMDPIGLAGGANRRGYVEGNPLGFIDPMGLQTGGMGFPNLEGEFRNYQETLINTYTEVLLFAATDGAFGMAARAMQAHRAAKAAEAARDAAGAAGYRNYATYSGGSKDGTVVVGRSRNPQGCAEDDIARQLGSDAQMTKAFGWRRSNKSGEVEWTEIPVCFSCQTKYQPFQFPKDVKAAPGGAWRK